MSESVSQPISQIDEFKKFLADNGFFPPEIPVDQTKIYRFQREGKRGKRNAWLIAFSNFQVDTGKEYLVAVFGDWSTGEEFTFKSGGVSFSAHDKQVIDKQIRERKIKAEREKFFFQKETQKEAIELLQYAHNYATGSVKPRGMESGAGADGEIDFCPYLVRKGFEKGALFGAALYRGLDDKPCTLVPMRDSNGVLWGLQRIYSDGAKFFLSGQRVDGLFHVIGDEIKTGQEGILTLCEGFATGASLHLATGRKIVVCFTANNLEKVAQVLRKENPDCGFLICGDDDRFNKDGNAGREGAEKAAIRTLGKTVYPTFTWGNDTGTDFNDLHLESGLESVRAQVEAVKIAQNYVRCLGHRDGTYFYTTSENKQIVPMREHSSGNLLKLMRLEYWKALYPKEQKSKKDGDGIDWMNAASVLISKCHERGIFNPLDIRGAGVWNDQGRIVVNMGNHLIVDGKKIELGDIRSQYFYTEGMRLSQLREDALTAEECRTFVDACLSFKWVKPEFGYLMAGGLVISRICGALPIRPHIWLTGAASTGKSTLFTRLIKPVLGNNYLNVQGGTTEAGLRQSLQANAIPVIYDEFETNTKKSEAIVDSVIELFRCSWSDSSALTIKGGAGGNPSGFQARCSAIVSSIRIRLNNDADISRFAKVELRPHDSDAEHWKKLSELLEQIDEAYGEKLFARSIRLIPTLVLNFKKIKAALARQVGQRFGDQYGMLLAGYSILIQDEPITDEEAWELSQNMSLIDEREIALNTDHEDALTHLISKKIQIMNAEGQRIDFSCGEAISRANGTIGQWIREGLQQLGIRVDEDSVFIASQHTELESQIYRGTRWSQNWAHALCRISGAEKKVVWVFKKSYRGVSLPFRVFHS